MNVVDLAALIAGQAARGVSYLEVLRVPTLSAGLYRLPVGAADPQQPHTEDEVYYVVAGRGAIRVGDEDRPIAPGALIYVAAGMPHHFHTITEDLALLVLFAPAEYTLSPTMSAGEP